MRASRTTGPRAEIAAPQGAGDRALRSGRGAAPGALLREAGRPLQDRFPDAVLRDVEGLVKLVDREEIKAYDWSLTPGRYVGVAPEEVDEDFDFEEALHSIHIDLKGLNEEAAELAARIARNFEELGLDLQACTLGQVVKLRRGHDLPERARVAGSVPVVSSAGVTGWHNVAKAARPVS